MDFDYTTNIGDSLLGQIRAAEQNAPNIARFERIENRMAKIEKELNQMHALMNKLCPGSNTKGGLTVAEKFEKLLTEGPEWVEIKKEEKE
jgi:hypothetical protein